MIVKAFTFASDQVKAVRLIARYTLCKHPLILLCCVIYPLSHVYDPTNKYAILDAITFSSDKDEAKKILDNTPSAQPPAPATAYVQAGHFPQTVTVQCPAPVPYQPPPQQQAPYQPPNPGGYPPPPAQGGYPPPPQGTYPPPPAQGTYPPAQGGYPPPAAGYGQPPSGGINFQFGVGGAGGPPASQQQAPPPGEVNMQFGLGGFGLPTGNISFQTNPAQPPPWP